MAETSKTSTTQSRVARIVTEEACAHRLCCTTEPADPPLPRLLLAHADNRRYNEKVTVFERTIGVLGGILVLLLIVVGAGSLIVPVFAPFLLVVSGSLWLREWRARDRAARS